MDLIDTFIMIMRKFKTEKIKIIIVNNIANQINTLYMLGPMVCLED